MNRRSLMLCRRLLRTVLLSILFPVAFGGAAARADTVVMRNGKTYNGKIKSTADGILVIRSEGIDWTLPLKQVASQETNDEGVEDAKVIVSQEKAPPPAPAPTKEARGKKGRKGKGGPLPLVIAYVEDNCKLCDFLKGTLLRNNSILRFEVRNVPPGQRGDLCNRARGLKLNCNKLPIVEYNGKLYEGSNMEKASNGLFAQLSY